MGSPVPQKSPEPVATVSAAPEVLARAILRCRELASFLETALPLLPGRSETPFLYGQLDDVLQRLHSSLRQLALDEPAPQGAGFLRRLAGKKPAAPRKSEARYDLEGNAWTIPVTELVGFLSHAGKSGLLWVTSPVETFVLEFSRGSLVHATSNAPPVAFRLGEILLKEKMLEPAELARVIDHAKAADDLLGSYLVRSGRLRHADLQRALAIQVQELFHRLMDAENALYRFQEGGQLMRSHQLEVNITQLLLESARKKDEERQKDDARRAREAAKSADAAVDKALAVLDERRREPRTEARPKPRAESRVEPRSEARPAPEPEAKPRPAPEAETKPKAEAAPVQRPDATEAKTAEPKAAEAKAAEPKSDERADAKPEARSPSRSMPLAPGGEPAAPLPTPEPKPADAVGDAGSSATLP